MTQIMDLVIMSAALLSLALVGLPLAVLLGSSRRDPALLLARTMLCGLAFWVVAFWWLRPFGGSLGELLAGGWALSAVLAVVVRRRLVRALADCRPRLAEGMALAALLTVSIVRLLPMLQALVPPGADMSMHAAMAMLIHLANGVPTSYLPILPIHEFGSYAAGLPTLAALLAHLVGRHVVETSFFVSCTAHALVSWATYAALRSRVRSAPALLGALLVSCATCDPQFIFRWGGNPTVLALAFVLPAVPPLVDGTFSRVRRRAVPVAVLVAAAALTHAVLPYALAWVVMTVAVMRAARAGRRAVARGLVNGALVTLLTVALAAPYLTGFSPPLSAHERAITHAWQLLPEHVPAGHGWTVLLHLSGHVGDRLGQPIMLWTALALGLCLALGRRLRMRDGVFAATVLALVLNAFVWILPASYVLYPDRLLLLLLWPMAAVLADAFAAVEERARARGGCWQATRRILVGVALGTLPLPVYAWYLVVGPAFSDVTPSDVAAVQWLAANTPPGVVIGTNYEDAGRWVPALIARPVTRSHVHFLYADEVAAWQATLSEPRVVFVGAKAGGRCHYTLASMAADPRYREVFHRGAAAVFVRAGPTTPRSR